MRQGDSKVCVLGGAGGMGSHIASFRISSRTRHIRTSRFLRRGGNKEVPR